MVRILLKQLVHEGHLSITGNGGFKKANHHQIIIKTRNHSSTLEQQNPEPQFHN